MAITVKMFGVLATVEGATSKSEDATLACDLNMLMSSRPYLGYQRNVELACAEYAVEQWGGKIIGSPEPPSV